MRPRGYLRTDAPIGFPFSSHVTNSPAPPPLPPGLANYPGPHRLLKAGLGYLQADVWATTRPDGQPAVWKSWWRRPLPERVILCRWLAGREHRVLCRLDGLPEVPRALNRPDPFTIEMTLLDAEPVAEVKRGGALPPEYFTRLWALLAEMHRRGVNHGDLRRKNLLRAPEDPASPRMVDFTQCLCVALPPRGIGGLLLRQAVRVDRAHFLKLKKWYLGPEHMTPEELSEMERTPWHLSLGRFFRRGLYRPLKHWRRGRRRSGPPRRHSG